MSKRKDAERAIALHELKNLIMRTGGTDPSGLKEVLKRDLARKLDEMNFTSEELRELYDHARIYMNTRMQAPIMEKMKELFPNQFALLAV